MREAGFTKFALMNISLITDLLNFLYCFFIFVLFVISLLFGLQASDVNFAVTNRVTGWLKCISCTNLSLLRNFFLLDCSFLFNMSFKSIVIFIKLLTSVVLLRTFVKLIHILFLHSLSGSLTYLTFYIISLFLYYLLFLHYLVFKHQM